MSRKRVAILISGGGSNMLALATAMQNGTVAGDPVLVLSNHSDAGGLTRADRLGIRTEVLDHTRFASREAFDATLSQQLEAVAPDIICLAGFMRILTPGFTERWSDHLINIHPSLLPLFKGLHTHQRVLDTGMTVHGATVHRVTSALDDGPILGQAIIPVLSDDTAQDLANRLLPQEHRLYVDVLRALCADQTPKIFIAPPEK